MTNIFKQQGYGKPQETVEIPQTYKIFGQTEEVEELDEENSPKKMTREEIAEYFKEEIDEIKNQVCEKASKQAAEIAYKDASEVAYKDAYEKAYQEAYQEAFHKRKGEVIENLKNVDEQLEQIQKMHKEFLRKYAFELKYLAIDIAQKFIIKKMDSDDQLLDKMILHAVANVKNTAWLDIEVSDKLVNLVEILKEEIKNSDDKGRVTISAKACPEDTCRINTEEGTIVSTISAQADNLRELFEAEEAKL